MIRRSVFVYIAVLALLVSGIFLPEVLGANRQDYSSFANFISELGETGSTTEYLTNRLAFPLVGITCFLIIIAFWHRLPASKAVRSGLICLALGLPCAYIGAAVFPCDLGCPIEGSTSQTIHNFLGLVQYPLAVIGLAILSQNLKFRPAWRFGFALAAAAMTIGFVMMLLPSQESLRGLWQRLGDYTTFIILSYIVLLTQGAKSF